MGAIANFQQTASGRLRLFYLLSYLISFTVLALGFGAEATQSVVTQANQKQD
ncbi:MAG: hypothetical protein WBA57_10865 [Elainellaceae cyanobacterium]